MFNLSHKIHTIDELLHFDYKIVKKRKNHKKIEYIDLVSSFDIEVSSFYDNKKKVAVMYAYAFGINGKSKIGRTWEEFLNDLKLVKEKYNISLNKRLIIYVHNLSYEFQFLMKRIEREEVFAIDNREVCVALSKMGFEFRCSYILSNQSLESIGEHLEKYKVNKMVGDLDYSLIRSPLTKMSEKELTYLLNDTLVVMAYIKELEEKEKSLIYIPLTSTGFVRNYCRKHTISVKENYKYRGLIKRLKLRKETYLSLCQAFMGGFTHASSFWSNGLCKDVYSYDLTSSYPTALISEKYPMSSGYTISVNNEEELERLMKGYCVLMDISFINIKESFIYEHYISESKCIELENKEVDNGRIVKADKVRLLITDIDYSLIKKTYTYEKATINNCIIFKKEYLPKEFIKCVLDFYVNKTTLKGIKGKESDYMRFKNLLNATYGMCCTNPCRDEIIFNNGEWEVKEKDIPKSLKNYNVSKSRFLFYAWGVWCTAYARQNLWSAILTIKNDYIYSDTDSVKIYNKDKYSSYFNAYNKEIEEKLVNALNYHNLDVSLIKPVNDKGEIKLMGVWDYEGHYQYFKTLGAKRYMYFDTDLHITIAGVNKKSGAKYLKWKFKDTLNIFKNFTNNLYFPATYIDENNIEQKACGKLTHTYIDEERKGVMLDYLGVPYQYDELSSVHLENTDYSLNMYQGYLDYIQGKWSNFLWQNRNIIR